MSKLKNNFARLSKQSVAPKVSDSKEEKQKSSPDDDNATKRPPGRPKTLEEGKYSKKLYMVTDRNHDLIKFITQHSPLTQRHLINALISKGLKDCGVEDFASARANIDYVIELAKKYGEYEDVFT